MKPKRIVVVGGGSGSYNILKGLKEYSKKGLIELTAIVAMTDSGGSSGQLMDEFGFLPPGDLRRCLVALSDETEIMKKLFQHRFESNGNLNDHSVGNLFITALTQITGNENEAIKEAHKILKVNGKIIPVTLEKTTLVATLEDNEKVIGETNIDLPRKSSNKKIISIMVEPKAKANPEAIREIKKADFIIIGPGDLYTSIIANLVIGEISKSICESKAKKIYISNIMTKFGETNNFTLENHLSELEKYLKKNCIDLIVYNNSKIPAALLAKYKKENAQQVEFQKNLPKSKFVGIDLVTSNDIARHNPKKIGKVLMKIIRTTD